MNGAAHNYLAVASGVTVAAVAAVQPDEPIGRNAVAVGVLLAMTVVGGEPGPDWDLKAPLKWFCSHRGLTHRLWLHVLLVAGIYFGVRHFVVAWLAPYAATGLGVGLLSHAIGDMMTPRGLCYLAPFYGEAIHVLPFRLRVCPDGPPTDKNGHRIVVNYTPISQAAVLAPVSLAYLAVVLAHFGVIG